MRQGRYLSLHDEVKNFPLQHWLRSTIIAAGSLLVLFMLLFWIPLDMPLKFTLSWMKGAQTIEATSVKQLADAGVRVGDTLRISGTGMCNIRTSGTGARKPIHLFYRLTARRSSGTTPAHYHYQNLNWSTKRRH